MKKIGLLIAALILVGLGYLAGARQGLPAKGGASAPPAGSEERKIAFYRNPMDPSIHSDHPAKDSMGMDFIPVYTDEVEAPASSVEGRAAVVNDRTGERLTMTWDVRENDVLGLWLTRGGWHGHHHLALEPTNGFPDSLADHQKCAVLKAGEQRSWSVTFTVGHT